VNSQCYFPELCYEFFQAMVTGFGFRGQDGPNVLLISGLHLPENSLNRFYGESHRYDPIDFLIGRKLGRKILVCTTTSFTLRFLHSPS
jgi:hypothetical protein